LRTQPMGVVDGVQKRKKVQVAGKGEEMPKRHIRAQMGEGGGGARGTVPGDSRIREGKTLSWTNQLTRV